MLVLRAPGHALDPIEGNERHIVFHAFRRSPVR